MKFVLPADFKPDLVKEYDGFKVAVQNMDITIEQSVTPVPTLLWHFAIYVGDVIVDAGPFHWDPAKRALTDENVCNHLASFYRDSRQVKEGRPLPEPEFVVSTERRDDHHAFLAKATAMVWSLFYESEGLYQLEDLAIDSYTDLGGMKCALISNKHNPSIVYEVEYNSLEQKTTVTHYVEVAKYEIADDEL